MENEINVNWMDEPIEKFPGKRGFYRLMCLILLKKRMTYANMYVLAYALNKDKYKDNEVKLKEKILKELAWIYYYNNGKLPNSFKFNDKEK